MTHARKSTCGFTYVGLLILIVLLSVALLANAALTSTMVKRDREAELLFVGGEYRRAIKSYVEAEKGLVKPLPRSLNDLVLDKRFQIPIRHLRRHYRDPMTNDFTWGLITQPDGGIIGVHSLSEGRPLKIGNFAADDATLANKTRYSEWLFVIAQTAPPKKAAPAVPGTDQLASAGKGSSTGTLTPGAPSSSDQLLGPSVEPTRKICEQLVRNDTLACASVRASFGAIAGNSCLMSSNARVEACNATQPVPPLDRGP
jgi:type II secretory pathway pseudopilin PulG